MSKPCRSICYLSLWIYLCTLMDSRDQSNIDRGSGCFKYSMGCYGYNHPTCSLRKKKQEVYTKGAGEPAQCQEYELQLASLRLAAQAGPWSWLPKQLLFHNRMVDSKTLAKKFVFVLGLCHHSTPYWGERKHGQWWQCWFCDYSGPSAKNNFERTTRFLGSKCHLWFNMVISTCIMLAFGKSKATSEEFEEASKGKKATSAKSKAKPKDSKHDRSPQKPNQASPNPGQPKRIKGKQSEPDQGKMIEELRKVTTCFFWQESYLPSEGIKHKNNQS